MNKPRMPEWSRYHSFYTPSFIRNNLLAKFVATVLVVLLVISAVGVTGYVQTSETVRDDSQKQMKSTATLQAETISAWITEKKQRTRSIASTKPVQSNHPATIQNYFRLRKGSFTGTEVHYVDAESDTVLASTRETHVNVSFEDIDKPWSRSSAYGNRDNVGVVQPVWTGNRTFESRDTQDQMVYFVTPLSGDNDHYLVHVASLERRVNSLFQPRQNQSTSIVTEDGKPLIAGVAGTEGLPEYTRTNVSGPDYVEGADRVYATAPVDGADWIVVTSVPKSVAFSVAKTVGRIVKRLVGLGLVGLVVAAVILGRQTVPALTELRRKVGAMEEGDFSVDLSGERSDEIGELFAGFSTMRDSLRDRMQEAQTARQEAETAREETERMNRHLEEKAAQYNDVIERWANGDLTERLDAESRNAAMTEIAEDLNKMVSDLEATVHQVKGFADKTTVASNEVSASTQQVRNASEKVTESIQEISFGAERQNEQLVDVSGEMNNLSATTEEIASLSAEVAEIAERTSEFGREGRDAAEAAIEGMQEIEMMSDDAVTAMTDLEEEVRAIDDLLEFITDVAEQTNILALNANIEAARAGEAGEGFAVVADEVKSLAEETRQAAEDIEQRLDRMNTTTDQAVREVKTTSETIDEQVASVENAVDALDEIAESARETNDGIQEISDITRQQASTTEQIVTMVGEVTTISEETATEAETVASAAEEQSSALIEISGSVEELAQQADYLEQMLDSFETGVDEEVGDGHLSSIGDGLIDGTVEDLS